MLKKALTTVILIASIGMTMPAVAAIGRIISQNDAAEASIINIIFDKNLCANVAVDADSCLRQYHAKLPDASAFAN